MRRLYLRQNITVTDTVDLTNVRLRGTPQSRAQRVWMALLVKLGVWREVRTTDEFKAALH